MLSINFIKMEYKRHMLKRYLFKMDLVLNTIYKSTGFE